MEIGNFQNEFTDDGDISDGDRTFPGATLSSNNYEEIIRRISILPRMGVGEPLAEEEQFALRSDLGGN